MYCKTTVLGIENSTQKNQCVVNEMYDNTALEISRDKGGTKNGY